MKMKIGNHIDVSQCDGAPNNLAVDVHARKALLQIRLYLRD